MLPCLLECLHRRTKIAPELFGKGNRVGDQLFNAGNDVVSGWKVINGEGNPWGGFNTAKGEHGVDLLLQDCLDVSLEQVLGQGVDHPKNVHGASNGLIDNIRQDMAYNYLNWLNFYAG